MGFARLELLIRLAACALALLLPGRSLAVEPLKVLVLSEGADAALVERLHGQLSDLYVAIELVPAASSDRRSVERALGLAEQRGAAVAVWFEQPDPAMDHLFVQIAELRTRRVMVRELGERTDGTSLSSSTREAAALVVREALLAVMAGVQIGDPSAPEVSHVRPMSPAPPAPVPSTRRPGRHTRALPIAALGWGAAFDGEAPLGHQGPVARLGARYGSLETLLFVELTLPSQLENRYGAIRLSRHAAGARWLLSLRPSPTFEVGLGARAGIATYWRRTTRSTPSVIPAKDRLAPSWLLGAETELAFRPRGSTWALMMAGGLDVIPEVIRVGYDVEGSRVLVAEPAVFQPRLLLGLRWTAR